jgi:hypothetical protein
MNPSPAAASTIVSPSLEITVGSAPYDSSSVTSSRSPEKAARINDVAKTMRGLPARMRARGVLLTRAFGLAPASSSCSMTGSGSAVTIQGKLGAVSMLRRSTAQNNGVKRCVSA